MTEKAVRKKEYNRRRAQTIMVLVSVLLVLLAMVLLFVNTITTRNRELDRASQVLADSAHEQAATLDATLNGKYERLETLAASLVKETELDVDEICARLLAASDSTAFNHISFIMPDGNSYTDSGIMMYVSDRAYFKQAMSGERSIERVENTALTNEPRIVLAVPMLRNGAVVGVVNGSYKESVLQGLLIPRVYGGEGYSAIYDQNGRLIIGSESPDYKLQGNNIFRALNTAKFNGGYSLDKLRADLASGEGGLYSYKMDGDGRYVSCVPLDIVDAEGNRWFCFNVLPESTVNKMVSQTTGPNLVFMGLVILICAAALLLILLNERRNEKTIRAERDRLRMSEEQFRIAATQKGRGVARYDVKTGAYYTDSPELSAHGFGSVIERVPEVFVETGTVQAACADDLLLFYEKIKNGMPNASADIAINMADGSIHWYRTNATMIYDAEDEPTQAIIVYDDITEAREKEAVYRKWQQSLSEIPDEDYTLFRANVSRGASFDSMEGGLLTIHYDDTITTFNGRTEEYATAFVFPDDRAEYIAFLDSDTLLAKYYRGIRKGELEYREMVGDGNTRWLKVSVELVEYPNSKDVEAYLMYENIDVKKKAELLAKERAETDPLTGVLNRMAFMDAFDTLAELSSPEQQHALLMLDIDGFKLVNDTFGHVMGDKTLTEITTSLRAMLRPGDLLGRLGGDEFIVCLKDIPYDAIIEKKAVQICELVRKSFSDGVFISASVGVAVFPKDGTDFSTLYKKVDAALYYVKENGRDNFAFFEPSMLIPKSGARKPTEIDGSFQDLETKRRILIVDDNEMVRALLSKIFEDRFIIETAFDGRTALIRMRHFGASIAVVLLDLVMPGMDGFEVLKAMQSSSELQSIPVIVVSSADDRETSLAAIKCGASDYVSKPIDPDLIRLRVKAVISKTENERLRAQNSYLQLQSGEETKYRTVLESTGTVVVEYDWINKVFVYDSNISKYIFGHYDERKLWRILLSDMVANALDVKDMQEMVQSLAEDKENVSASMVVQLKTPNRAKHWFRMRAFKQVNEYNLTERILMTFNDINDEVLSNEKLIYQAERDELTGLYNRRTFLKNAEERVKSKAADTYIMAVADIDNFKIINDRFGHAEGDKLLEYTADALKEDVADIGGLVGRLGNDVFAALVPNTPESRESAQRYPKQILSQYPLKIELVCSMGCCLIDDPSAPIDSILDRAALAKSTVKGQYDNKTAWYDEGMRKKMLLEQEIIGSMETALASEQFVVFFQPQYNHATAQLTGAEALVRWKHPEKGMISPGVFIPVFEKNGFITRLDEYVWNKTAEFIRDWLSEGHAAVPVAVNISRVDVSDPTLCDRLLAIVRKNRIPISLFRLEITESTFVEETDRLASMIDKLHEQGFIVEMDDFGSGYSSLNTLKDVPVDVLKLDMRFFDQSVNNARGGTIINGVMRMARWLNLPVIAEGVETTLQADFLTSIGCPIIQGYLYAKPMPMADFRALLMRETGNTDDVMKGNNHDPKVNAFWNPDSTDSQLFYGLIGAAVIYEYKDGNFEALRVNRQFLELLKFDLDVPLPTTALIAMAQEDKPLFAAAAEKTIETGEMQELLVRRVFSDGEPMLVRCRLRLIARGEGRSTLLCNVELA